MPPFQPVNQENREPVATDVKKGWIAICKNQLRS